MATLTATPNRFRSSTSGMPNPDSLEMSLDLPKIDFGEFNRLRAEISQSKDRLTKYTKRADALMQQRKNNYKMSLSRLDGDQKKQKQQIRDEEVMLAKQEDKIAKAMQESKEMNDAIRSFTLEKEKHTARQSQIRERIADVKSAIKSRREAQAMHQQSLDVQAKQNIPELRFWETCLGMRIEGTGVDGQLRFVFSCVDPENEQRECWFDVAMGGQDYEVVATKPRLEKEYVDDILERLNETKDLDVYFLKDMRSLFVATIRS